MSTIQDYDLCGTFEIERKLLRYCGLYPKEENMKNAYSHYLFGFCSFLLTFSLYISMIIVISIHITDMSVITDVLQLFMTNTAFMCKLLNLILSGHQLVKVERLLSKSIFYGQSGKNLKIIIGYVSFTKSVAVMYRLACLGGTLFMTACIFFNDLDHIIPILGWNPWGADDKGKCIVTHSCYLVMCFLQIFINACIDTLTYMLMTLAAALFEILKNNLSEIRYDTKDAKHIFARNIQLHYKTLRLVDYIEKIFSNGIFVQFLASVVVICFTAFQVTTVSPTSIQFLFVFSYFICMFYQVTMYCWFGHKIITSSDKLCEAVYMSNWYQADLRLKKSIIIFMERCKTPVVLTAGNFIPLSLTTLVSIMKTSYSYFTVLQGLYGEE